MQIPVSQVFMTDLYNFRYPQQCSLSEAEQWSQLNLCLLHSGPAADRREMRVWVQWSMGTAEHGYRASRNNIHWASTAPMEAEVDIAKDMVG